jgi:shikimate dehydrogenase
VLTPGQAAFAGVLGWPLEHTLSPVIHNAAFRSAGLHAVYLSFPVAPGDLPAAVAGLRALGALGANVTMPHKETIVELLDGLSAEAAELGAVNTVERAGDRLVGHNTDVEGFHDFLVHDAEVDVGGRRVLVLGSGGAARAVVVALSSLGAADLAVAARRPERAARVTALARGGGARAVAWERREEIAQGADLVVNATPIGGRGDDPLPGVVATERQAVIDLVYGPSAGPLVVRARGGGARAWDGLGMLVRQGAASWRIWTGADAPLSAMMQAARGAWDIGAHSLAREGGIS